MYRGSTVLGNPIDFYNLQVLLYFPIQTTRHFPEGICLLGGKRNTSWETKKKSIQAKKVRWCHLLDRDLSMQWMALTTFLTTGTWAMERRYPFIEFSVTISN